MKTKYMQSTHNPFNSQGKMFHHISKLMGYKLLGDTSPILIEINLTNKCNLNCYWCISSYSHKNETIKTDYLINFLKEYKSAGGKAVTWSGGGEPTLHPDFIFILKETHKIGLDQGIMSNGIFNKKLVSPIAKYCEWIRVSLDTLDNKRYKQIKGIDSLSIAKRNIIDLNKKQIKVGININLPQDNYNYVSDLNNFFMFVTKHHIPYLQIRPVLPRIYKKEKIDLKILKKQISVLKTFDTSDKITVSWDKFYDLLYNKKRSYTKCRGHIFECVLDANGDLVTCMYFLKNKKFIFGNIYENSFEQIWYSQKRKRVKKMCDKLNFNKCQVCCKCHEINKLLDFIDNDIEDKNFI